MGTLLYERDGNSGVILDFLAYQLGDVKQCGLLVLVLIAGLTNDIAHNTFLFGRIELEEIYSFIVKSQNDGKEILSFLRKVADQEKFL